MKDKTKLDGMYEQFYEEGFMTDYLAREAMKQWMGTDISSAEFKELKKVIKDGLQSKGKRVSA